MIQENEQKQKSRKKWAHSAKECAYLAVFVALVIALQLALSLVPGVECVTVMFVVYAYVMGWKRGMLAATAFALLRQIVFGVFLTVLILYLLYFNLLAFCFGMLGKRERNLKKFLPIAVVIACMGTIAFTMIDNVLTPLWYGYSQRDTILYFRASLPFMIPQVICTALTVSCLFLPLCRVFQRLRKSL